MVGLGCVPVCSKSRAELVREVTRQRHHVPLVRIQPLAEIGRIRQGHPRCVCHEVLADAVLPDRILRPRIPVAVATVASNPSHPPPSISTTSSEKVRGRRVEHRLRRASTEAERASSCEATSWFRYSGPPSSPKRAAISSSSRTRRSVIRHLPAGARPAGALTCTLRVGLPEHEPGTFGPRDRCKVSPSRVADPSTYRLGHGAVVELWPGVTTIRATVGHLSVASRSV